MPDQISLDEIANYHRDAEASLRTYFSAAHSGYYTRFAAYLPSEVNEELTKRISETDMRSALVVMARIEAAFYADYKERCKQKGSDAISKEFRKIHKHRGVKARLDDDIWTTWRQNSDPQKGALISQLRSVFKFRHWLAHGRYWPVGAKFGFQDVYLLAETVFANFSLCG